MAKKGLFTSSFILMTLFLVATVSANIIISQPKSLYNLGDTLELSIQLDELKLGYLDINLICANNNVNIYHNVPENNKVNIKRNLIPLYIQEAKGNCYILAEYEGNSESTQSFEISNKITLTTQIDKLEYTAGDSVVIKGNAIKENTQPITKGLVESTLNELIKANQEVNSDSYSLNFTIPENLKSGNYKITIKANDKDSMGNILNVGEKIIDLKINQKPGKIDIAINNAQIIPGETIEIIPALYDKAGEIMDSNLLIKIENSNKNTSYESIIKNNEKITYKLAYNEPAGYSKIILQKDEVISEKSFEVKTLEKISAEIKNGTLTIRNIGNVPYNKTIEISIDGTVFKKNVLVELAIDDELILGELKGNESRSYDVILRDEKETILDAKGITLPTGAVIGLDEATMAISQFFTNYPIVWFFILIIIVLGAYIIVEKTHKNKFYKGKFWAKNDWGIAKDKDAGIILANKEENRKSSLDIRKEKQELFNKKIKLQEIKNAELVAILQGKKEKSSIIALKIKDGNLNGSAKESIDKIIDYATNKSAVTYLSENYILIIFVPSLTSNQNNERTAIQLAQHIEDILERNNKLFKDRIIYGLGVTSGEIITKIEDNVLKFNAINKTIVNVKKVAHLSNGEVLLSKEIHLATAAAVKTDKGPASGNIETFKVKRIINTEESRKFIDDFTKRHSFGSNNSK